MTTYKPRRFRIVPDWFMSQPSWKIEVQKEGPEIDYENVFKRNIFGFKRRVGSRRVIKTVDKWVFLHCGFNTKEEAKDRIDRLIVEDKLLWEKEHAKEVHLSTLPEEYP